MNKNTLITVLALGILVSAGYFGSSLVRADDLPGDPHDTLITRIAEKFNLNKDEVQAVFDSVRDERQARMLEERTERLNQAVTDGVITGDQKNKLVARMEESRELRLQGREEMQQWFADNGIDGEKLRSYLMPEGGKGRHIRFAGPVE